MKRKSDGTPARNDDDGWKKGALGKHSPGVKLDRNYDPWNPKVLSDGLSDGKGAYTDNKNVLNHKDGDPTRENPWGKSKDIYDNAVKNSLDDDAGGSRPGPIKYGVD
jgi:hypothetical protein